MKRGSGILLLFFSLGLTVGVWGGEALRTHKSSPVSLDTPETVEPPLALGPEPKDPDERVGWIERIIERRMTRALEADPDAKGGPIVDALAAALAQFVRKLLKLALELAVAAAIVAFLWAHWPWIVAWSVGHIGLSWVAGRFGSKKGT